MLSYFFILYNKLLEIIQNEKDFLGTVAIKGVGSSIEEAKRPLNNNVQKKGWTWEEYERHLPEQNQETLQLILNQKGKAFGVHGYPNILFIDIDFYKIKNDEIRNEIQKKIDYLKEETYVEETGRGGYHIAFLNPAKKNYLVVQDPREPEKFIDVKYRGYVITYPSRLYANGKIFEYKKISKIDISEIYSIELDDMDAMEFFGNWLVEAEMKKDSIKFINIDYKLTIEPGQIREYLRLPEDPLEGLRKLADIIKCPGLKTAIEYYQKTGKFPIKKVDVPMSVPRGSHFLFEVEYFTLLLLLYGDKKDKIKELVEKVDYIDGISSSPPWHTFIHTVAKGDYVVPKGLCPFIQICKTPCPSTCVYKLRNLLIRIATNLSNINNIP